MPQAPANPNVRPDRYNPFWFRFFEIVPGACAWIALIAPFFLSFTYPLAVTVFIIIFDVYWLVQAFNYGYILLLGYYRLKRNLGVDWQAMLHSLETLPPSQRKRKNILDWREIYSAVILTTYREATDILRASLTSLVEAEFPQQRMIVVLAVEERGGEADRAQAEQLKKEFGEHFHRFIISIHPDGIIGEIKAKSANVTWAAKQLAAAADQDQIPYDRIVVSTADGDTRFDRRYFACLTYAYAILPNRIRCAYQPISTYFNNIWDAPMVSRVFSLGDTFWTLIESVRNYRLITFSTHAMSLQALADINFWDTAVVSEDSRQFFRGYFHYHGDFHVVPLFMPIYMDAVHSGSVWQSARNLYLQKERWAYGVEHFPYIVMESLRQPTIPLLNRWMLIWRAWQGAFSWATSSFFITFIGWLPILLNANFRDQVVVSNFVGVTKLLLTFTWFGLIISSYVTVRILRILPHRKGLWDHFGMIIQWMMVPFVAIFFSAFPGLHAQTRLMLGKYLGFRVTEKIRPPAATTPKPA